MFQDDAAAADDIEEHKGKVPLFCLGVPPLRPICMMVEWFGMRDVVLRAPTKWKMNSARANWHRPPHL